MGIIDGINAISDFLIGAPKKLELHTSEIGGIGKIKRQDLPFLMEIEINGVIKSFLFPRSVESIKYQHVTRQSVTHTQGGLFADVIGTLPPKIVMSGTFGYYNTASKDGMDGYMTSYMFENLVKAYYSMFQKYAQSGGPVSEKALFDPTSANYIQLQQATDKTKMIRFYDFTMNQYWEVIVDSFNLHRSTQRRLLYMYDMQITAIKGVGGQKEKDELLEYLSRPTIKPNVLLTGLNTLQSGLTSVKKFLVATSRLVGTIKGQLDKVTNMVKQVTSLLQEAQDQTTAIASIPSDIAYSFHVAVKELLSEMADTAYLPAEHLIVVREGLRMAFTLEKATRTNNVSSVSTEGKTSEQQLFASPYTQQMKTVARQTINDNDTIHTIAAKTGVSWQQLVAMNGLSAPFVSERYMDRFTPELTWGNLATNVKTGDAIVPITGATVTVGSTLVINGEESGLVLGVDDIGITLATAVKKSYAAGARISIHEKENKVLAPGDKIDIPGTTGGVAGSLGLNFEESLYWIDEMLDANGNMVAQQDVVTVGGMTNLEMQLVHRLATRRGELAELGHKEYGGLLPEFIGKINTELWLKRAQIECESIVKEDPRVADVAGASLRVDGTAIYFEGNVYPINQSAAIQIALPLS